MASCPPRPRRRSRRWESRTWTGAWTPPRRATRPDDIRALMRRYEETGIDAASLGAVGYRVVHGGERFREPVLVTPKVIAEVDALRSLAPLHNGIAVATMKAGLAAIPQLPHVAVFDTAFHAPLPEDAYRYAVPERWYRDWGVRRYGFHGMSVAWPSERAATLLARPAGELRLVVAHLGSGCSVTARRSMGGAPSLPRWASRRWRV